MTTEKGELGMKRYVIPPQMWPSEGIEEVVGNDGKRYLARNDAMFTGVKHSQAEFSDFFLAIRDECRIFGHRCPICNHIIVPPFQKRCPPCGFTELYPEDVTDRGFMSRTAVITMFPPARFKGDAPFVEGYVYLYGQNGKSSDTAIKLRCRTTNGMNRPGIFTKGVPVKIVFRSDRMGNILDLFAVPESELTREQIEKSPLLESDIDWADVTEPSLIPSVEAQKNFKLLRDGWKELAERIEQSSRAQADLSRWKRLVRVKTAGGEFSFAIENGRMKMYYLVPYNMDLVWAIEDPNHLVNWLSGGMAITNLVMDGTLWVSKNELETITRLDRVIRSLRRDNK